MKQIKSIGVWANPSLGKNDGFGYAGLKILNCMKRMGISTYWQDETSPVAWSFVQPHFYGGASSQLRIGYTPWESTVLPVDWIDIMNSQDYIWTTSEWCKLVFENNGVKPPIDVVHHGIDPHDWTLSKHEVQGKFKFFHMGEPADRKNGQMVVDAFFKAFPKDQDVMLVIKAHGYAECRIYEQEWQGFGAVRNIIGPVDIHPRIALYKDVWPIETLNSAFQQMNVLVYPSSGEGFGLIPFQSLATGMPSIFPAYSGMADFSEYGIPLEYEVGPSRHSYHLGDWCWPSFDDLIDKMRWVYDNYDEQANDSFYKATLLRQKFQWDKLIKDALERVGLEGTGEASEETLSAEANYS